MAYDEALAERIRDDLRDADGVTEKRMFGGLAFLTHGNLTVGVRGDELLVRLGPAATTDALREPGVRPFEMGARTSRGWVLVAGEQLDDAVLTGWITRAQQFVATLDPR